MAKLNWGANGERIYGAGVDRGVLYPSVGPGVAWNGLTSVDEAPSASDPFVRYIDGVPFRTQKLNDSFAATINAYMYPQEFEVHDGFDTRATGQKREPFGFSYRTTWVDDNDNVHYKIHLVYNALATPSKKTYDSEGEDVEIADFSWDITTTPMEIPSAGVSAHLIIDTSKAYSWTLEALENILYGDDDTEPRLPSPEEVLAIFDMNSILKITDHGDGTWSAEGPDEIVSMLDATSFQIDWPSAVYIDTESYIVRSL